MPVNKDESGRRWVEAEVEVTGTPEEVWRAIATGPGISSWFVPTQVEEREGGAIDANFGPGMDSHAKITAWNPPQRYVADSRDDMGPNDPTVATEWIVEARDGGKCVVRVVHSWFASGDDWDSQFEGHTHGWRVFFRILRLYLMHFSGQPSSVVQSMGMSSESKEAAWAKLTSALGLAGAAEHKPFQSAPGAPQISGVVERVGESTYPGELLLRLESPAPGIAHLFAMPMSGQVFLPMRLFFYGDQATEAAAGAEPQWQAWISQVFPPVAE